MKNKALIRSALSFNGIYVAEEKFKLGRTSEINIGGYALWPKWKLLLIVPGFPNQSLTQYLVVKRNFIHHR